MTRKTLPTWLPFAWLILLNVLATAEGYSLSALTPTLPIIAGLALANLIAAALLRVTNYFSYAVSGITLAGIAAVFLVPVPLGEIFVRNAVPALYLALLSCAVIPPLAGMTPFTYEFSRDAYPSAIVASESFRRVNGVMNAVWAGLFALAFLLSVFPYSDNEGLQAAVANILPIALLLGVGIPVNRMLSAWLVRRTPGERMRFDSVHELFRAMPYGLNVERARGVAALVQFHLSGAEPLEGYLAIKDERATFTHGVHESPRTTIRSDSTLWLQISNGEVSGERAYLNHEYEASGDLTVLLKLNDLFSPSEPAAENPAEARTERGPKVAFAYADLKRALRRVVVFDGGPRSARHSKTAMMAVQFCEGARSAGAEVEYVSLRKEKIRACTGCYTCWTRTPGVCVFDDTDDSMAALRRKLREADLVVLATPLYIFSATGQMKTFLDRTLPNLAPYMLVHEQGHTMHPHRYEDDPEQGLVVISAAGFPEVERNFDGLRGMVRCMASHDEKQHLLAELYLSAAEMIAQPVYADRLERVKRASYEAGRQAASRGRVDPKLMATVADPGVSSQAFREQANWFWERLDGKGAFLNEAPRLDTSAVGS